MEMSFSRRIAKETEALGLTADETRRRVLTVLFCTIGSLCAVLFGLITAATKPITGAVEIVLGGLCLFLVPWVALRFKRSFAAHFFLAGMSVGLTLASLLKGGLISSPAGWLPLGPVMAVLLLGPRAAVFWSFVFVCLNPVLAFMSASAWDPASGPIAVYAGSRTGAVLMGYLVAALFERARHRAYCKLERRRVATRLLLDHSDQGFVSVHTDGSIGIEYSSILRDWFGPVPESNEIADWISSADPKMGSYVGLVLDDISDDVFPLEVHLEQLRVKMNVAGRTIGLEAKEVSAARFLFVFTDMSESIALQKVEAVQRQTHAIITQMTNNSESFRMFCGETNRLFASINDELSDELLLRIVHTLKGNCLSHEIPEVAATLHEVEENFSPDDRHRIVRGVRAAEQQWRQALDPMLKWVDGADRVVGLDAEELQRMVAQDVGYASLCAHIRSLNDQPVWSYLEKLAHQGQTLGEQLGKPITFALEDSGLRLRDETWGPLFSSMVHLVANSIVHGIESPEERIEAGKDPLGLVELRAFADGDSFQLVVRDDGRGIDWGGLRKTAATLGLPCTTQEELEDAMFTHGVSTRDDVDVVSGRGVGTAALRHEVEQLGGSIEVESDEGVGTSFRLALPFPATRSAHKVRHPVAVSHESPCRADLSVVEVAI